MWFAAAAVLYKTHIITSGLSIQRKRVFYLSLSGKSMLSADNTKRPNSILDFFLGADFKATKMADKQM